MFVLRPFLLLTFLLLSFSGCSKQPQKKSILRINFASEPSTLDPRRGGDVTSSTLQFMLYEGLVRYAEDPLKRLGVAKSIDISKDGLTYTFHLREAKWSDGHPLTAFDFEYAYRSMMDPSFPCPNANLLYLIQYAREVKEGKMAADAMGVIAADASTLIIQLSHPAPYFLDLLSFCVFSPVPKHLAEKDPQWTHSKRGALVSNGPFILSEWKHQASLLLTKNPHYWQQDSIYIDQILATLISNQNTSLEMFKQKELDILGGPFSSLPLDAAKELIKENGLTIRPSASTSFLSFNLLKTPFQNPHIRKAFALAVNRTLLTQNITQLGEAEATGLIPPNLKYPGQQIFNFHFDPDLAKYHLQQGLNELGITLAEFPPIEYLFSMNDIHQRVALAIQDGWRTHLGIEVTLRGVEQKIYLDKLSSKDFDISQSFLLAQFSDQMNVLDRFKYRDNPKNHPGWYHPKYEKLINNSLYLKGEERAQVLGLAEALLIEEGALSPLYHGTSCSLTNPSLKGVYLSEICSIHWQGVRFNE
jgi:oligopeptide transport system substrate-binding protein